MKVYIILFLLIGSISLCAQAPSVKTIDDVSGSVAKIYSKARDALRFHDHKSAEKHLCKALKKEPNFLEAHRDLGLLYNSTGNYTDALPHLQFSKQYAKDWNAAQQITYLQLLWQLGHMEDVISTAEETLNNFNLSTPARLQVQKYLRDARFHAQTQEVNPDSISMEKMGQEINSDWPEYLPALTAEGNTLIFTRRIRNQENFYYSEKDSDGNWQLAMPVRDLNNEYNQGAMCISADGKTMIFTMCNHPDGFGSCDLYSSVQSGNRWTKPKNLGNNINTSSWESQPTLSPDGRTLYFVSNREGGHGGYDIWYSVKDARGNWQVPVNLGEPVNTPYDEVTPILHFDGQTLYFASQGHAGMGGHDLFTSRRETDNSWSTPVNLGSEINSVRDESGLAVSIDGQTAYYARVFSDENLTMRSNLFSFQLKEGTRANPSSYIKLKCIDAATATGLRAAIEIVDLETGVGQGIYQANVYGELLITLPHDRKYGAQVYFPGYIPYSIHFDLIQSKDPLELIVELQKIPEQETVVESKPIVLQNVFFTSGSAALLPESKIELEKLYNWMKNQPELHIRITGHTDNIGQPDFNQQLSLDRARSVANFLVEKGINAERVTYEGYGETQPVADNSTDEGRAQNRRTEFSIIYP